MKQLYRIALSLCLIAALVALGACVSPKDDGATKDGGAAKKEAKTAAEFAKWQNEEPFLGLALKDYVKLGQYKGIPLEAAKVNFVEEGDYVIFDFEGTAPGLSEETLAGMKAERYDQLVVGSGNFIPGFEEQMVGKKIGEPFEVNVTFPKDYVKEGEDGPKELNGKAVTFRCLVHPGKGNSLAAQAAYENMTVIKLPEREMEMERAFYDAGLVSSGMSEQEFLESNGLGTKEELLANSEEQLKQELFIYAIARQESLEAAQADVDAYLKEVRQADASALSIADEDLLAQMGGKNLLMRSMTRDKVVAFIYDNAKIS